MNPDNAYMGEYLRQYIPPRFNVHTVVNYLLAQPSAFVTMEVEFPDVSFWQGEVDYGVMGTKTDAIIIRAGQNTWKDVQFERNYAEAKKAGLLVGVYWFYDGRASPGGQAELLISILRDKKLELEVYLDWEHNYGGAHEGLSNVVAMMQVIEQAGLDIKGVGLYTGYYFFRANSNPIANASQYNYLRTKPLWLAWYSTNPADILVPAPWTDLTHWQWGTPDVEWGQQSEELDMNFFNGTKQEFIYIYGTPTGEPPMADYYELKPSVATEWRSIRAQVAYPLTPHIIGTKIGQIDVGGLGKAGTTVFDKYTYVSNISVNGEFKALAGDIWWKVYEANGQEISGWVAQRHLGRDYLTVRLVSETPVPSLPTLTIEVSDTEGKYIPVTVELKPK